jgi:hypothetical protein
MTKEELKKKILTDPEARKKFIAATAEYYRSVGLPADDADLSALAEHLNSAGKSGSAIRIVPIIIIIWEPPIGPVGRE